jgi:hypothetical protein
MPKIKFALESDGPERLEVKWKGGWFYVEGDAEVLLDGVLVGTIPHAELGAGKEFRLPDDSSLRVRIVDGTTWVSRDGKSLVTIAHPQRELKSEYNTFFFMAALNLVMIGISLAGFIKDASFANLITFLVCGVLFFSLGLWAKHNPKIAFVLGLFLSITEMIMLSARVDFDLIVYIIAMIWLAVEGIRAAQRAQK